MTRFLLTLTLTIAFSPTSIAQDMPLSQILIEGEGWKKVEGRAEKPPAIHFVSLYTRKGTTHFLSFPSKKTFHVADFPDVAMPAKTPTVRDKPTAALLTPDGGTLYLAGGAQQYLWAYCVEKDGTTTKRGRYAPLRVARGEQTTAVTALATDKDGRIYAATPLGVQVFDPTGRLCGVMTAPPGKAEHLAFEGNSLALWVGDTKYTRKLSTTVVD